ncbi:MAG: helix-turn-helix domain-containing protein [Spirochaetes bacterium]|nr:helix-turn-helix domain-containing protein [Spirochaetota bacterium]
MIQVIQRAATLLDSFESDPMAARTMSELAKLIEVEPPTCANIVKTMVDLGYLEPLPLKKGYRLGPTLWRLTSNGPYMKHIVDKAAPYVHEAAEKLRESCVLSILEGPRRVKLINVDSNRLLRPDSGGMVEGNAIRYATSRVHLAHMDESERRAWVSRAGWPGALWDGIASESSLEAACAQIREQGFAEATNADEDLVGLAWAVFQHGKVAAAFGIFLPESRFREPQRSELVLAGSALARKITQALG